MPTQTFFRLPEEKRDRLLEAAWQEFTATRFEDASINRIVRLAQIPRGSFYQYFGGKEDLFFHMLNTLREDFFSLVTDALRQESGDPLAGTLRLFDLLFCTCGRVLPSMERVIEVLKRNQNMDVLNMLMERIHTDPDMHKLAGEIDRSRFRSDDPALFRDVACLSGFAFVCAVRSVLCEGAQYEAERETLRGRLEIIRIGAERGGAER